MLRMKILKRMLQWKILGKKNLLSIMILRKMTLNWKNFDERCVPFLLLNFMYFIVPCTIQVTTKRSKVQITWPIAP